jgi:hypothetical protein
MASESVPSPDHGLLGFPARPEGSADAIRAGHQHWIDLDAFERLAARYFRALVTGAQRIDDPVSRQPWWPDFVAAIEEIEREWHRSDPRPIVDAILTEPLRVYDRRRSVGRISGPPQAVLAVGVFDSLGWEDLRGVASGLRDQRSKRPRAPGYSGALVPEFVAATEEIERRVAPLGDLSD